MAEKPTTVHDVYHASDAEATVALYKRLEAAGPAGTVAMNLLRACKASERAKQYRGGNSRGSYKRQAYHKKEWSILQLIGALRSNAENLGIEWGWGYDAESIAYEHVLYIELPRYGQVSFHMGQRHGGNDHNKPWDGVRGLGSSRIIRFATEILGEPQPVMTNGERDVERQDRAKREDAARSPRAAVRGEPSQETQDGFDL